MIDDRVRRDDLISVVDRLWLEHPRFPWPTIERLVQRLAGRAEAPSWPVLLDVVRLAAAEQLGYLDVDD